MLLALIKAISFWFVGCVPEPLSPFRSFETHDSNQLS